MFNQMFSAFSSQDLSSEQQTAAITTFTAVSAANAAAAAVLCPAKRGTFSQRLTAALRQMLPGCSPAACTHGWYELRQLLWQLQGSRRRSSGRQQGAGRKGRTGQPVCPKLSVSDTAAENRRSGWPSGFVRLGLLLTLPAVVMLHTPEALAFDKPVFPQLSKDQVHQAGKDFVINQQAQDMVISGKRANNVLIWDSFNLSNGFLKYDGRGQGTNTSYLNLVKGGGKSVINQKIIGSGAADGAVNFYLINPSGITVGPEGGFEHMKDVYLGTQKVDEKLIDAFAHNNDQALSLGEVKGQLGLGRGMGKIKVLGRVQAEQLILNGSQLILSDLPNNFTISQDSVALPETFELHSSTDRIDIGGDLERKVNNGSESFRNYLADKGYVAVSEQEIRSNGSLPHNKFVDHSQEQLIIYAEDLIKTFKNDPVKAAQGSYWLADNLEFDDKQFAAWRDASQDYTFSGSFDGAFNALTYEGTLDQAAIGAQGQAGFFSAMDGARVQNLKLYQPKLTLAADADGSDLKLGALAGTITGGRLSNIEVIDFDFDTDGLDLGADSSIGALAGIMTTADSAYGTAGTVGAGAAGAGAGGGYLHNVTAGFARGSEKDLLAAGLESKVGSFAGTGSGDWQLEGIVSGVSALEHDGLQAVGTSFGSLQEVASDLNTAWQDALGRGTTEEELFADYAVGGSSENGDLELQHKGFLKPFFVEDFNLVYDGREHSYLDMVNNIGFDLESLLNGSSDMGEGKRNAGEYGFALKDTQGQDNLGESFYFSYALAGENWDESLGNGSAAERSCRRDGLAGQGTMIINRKKVAVEIEDQAVDYGDTPNLTPGPDTIGNYGDLEQVVQDLNDKFSDLDITFTYNPETGRIEGKSDSGNYDVTFTGGEVAINALPIEPSTPIKPTDPIDPVNPVDPERPVIPEPKPEPPVNPEQPERPEQPVKPETPRGLDTGNETKCRNCGNSSEAALDHAFTLLNENAYIASALLDYSDAMMLALDSGISPDQMENFFEGVNYCLAQERAQSQTGTASSVLAATASAAAAGASASSTDGSGSTADTDTAATCASSQDSVVTAAAEVPAVVDAAGTAQDKAPAVMTAAAASAAAAADDSAADKSRAPVTAAAGAVAKGEDKKHSGAALTASRDADALVQVEGKAQTDQAVRSVHSSGLAETQVQAAARKPDRSKNQDDTLAQNQESGKHHRNV